MSHHKTWPLLAGILIVCCIFAAQQAYIFSITPDPCEDAYITFRYAKNLAEGNGPVFNPGERVEGYSNPLWMFSLALARMLGFDMAACSRAAGALCNALTLLLVWFIPRRFFAVRGAASLAGPVLYLLCLPLHFYAASGLETSLYTFLIIASTAAVLHAEISAGGRTAAFCLLLPTALTRPEGIIFCAFYCLWIGWRLMVHRVPLKPFLPGLSIFVLCYAAFTAWRISYYGLPFPNTYYAKGSFPLYVRLMLGFFTNKAFFSSYIWLVFSLPLFIFVRPAVMRRAAPLWLFIAAGLLFSFGFAGFDWMPYFRYNLPVMPLLIICCQLLFAEFWRSWTTSRGRKFVLAAATACILFAAAEQYWKDLSFNYRWHSIGEFARYNQRTLGEWIRRELGAQPRIAIGDVGYFAFISQANIIDLYGLTNREFAAIKSRYGAPDISFFPPRLSFETLKIKEGELLLRMAPDYVFFYNSRLKISDTYPGSAAGIADTPAFKNAYDYLTSFAIIPDFTSDAWPASFYTIDVPDLSAGLISWMRTGWGYDIYIRKDSPYPRFSIKLGEDEKIRTILTAAKP